MLRWSIRYGLIGAGTGRQTYRQAWALIWESNPQSRFDVVSADVVGNRIYLEAYVEHADGTMIPSMNILEVEGGRIRRGRVYTDRPVLDGVLLDDFVHDLNPAPTPVRGGSRRRC